MHACETCTGTQGYTVEEQYSRANHAGSGRGHWTSIEREIWQGMGSDLDQGPGEDRVFATKDGLAQGHGLLEGGDCLGVITSEVVHSAKGVQQSGNTVVPLAQRSLGTGQGSLGWVPSLICLHKPNALT